MKSKAMPTWRGSPTWLRPLIVALLVLGVFFRFVNLDQKVYWFDETITSLHLSGYTGEELTKQVLDGREIGIEDLQKYQRTNPEKGLSDTVKSLSEDCHHPPLYYLMARFWVQWFGNSVAVTRSFSAVISLLSFPCIYWLCQELFASSLIGWVAIALIAVSPFHVLYAQEAREYSLSIVTILLSSAALLQAMRLRTKFSWGIYAATTVLGLYSSLFFGLVAIGHGIYVSATESFRLSKTFIAYLLASVVGILAFTPWIFVVITNISQIQDETAWVRERKSLLYLCMKWAANLSQIFLDLVVYNNASYKNIFPLIIPILFLVVLVGYSLYFLCRRASKKVWLFILTLIGVTVLALALPDLIVGGYRSGTSRYLIPCYIGIQLAVAYLLATQIASIAINSRRQKLWRFVTLMLLSGGILSCVISSQAHFWWNKSTDSFDSLQVVPMINRTTHPLLIISTSSGDAMSLSYLLEPKVQLQWWGKQQNLPNINNKFSDTFLVDNTSDAWQHKQLLIQHNYKIDLVYSGRSKRLWKIEKQ